MNIDMWILYLDWFVMGGNLVLFGIGIYVCD